MLHGRGIQTKTQASLQLDIQLQIYHQLLLKEWEFFRNKRNKDNNLVIDKRKKRPKIKSQERTRSQKKRLRHQYRLSWRMQTLSLLMIKSDNQLNRLSLKKSFKCNRHWWIKLSQTWFKGKWPETTLWIKRLNFLKINQSILNHFLTIDFQGPTGYLSLVIKFFTLVIRLDC